MCSTLVHLALLDPLDRLLRHFQAGLHTSLPLADVVDHHIGREKVLNSRPSVLEDGCKSIARIHELAALPNTVDELHEIQAGIDIVCGLVVLKNPLATRVPGKLRVRGVFVFVSTFLFAGWVFVLWGCGSVEGP